ncbi:Na+/H+ antiporter [Campylobacter iguaniorum]|uniref:Na(+)/H(+) antiporter NhaA n=1 Tax=Campylobacter iguaniorum TaxID=1244531 RepID=A0A076F955_9BACT|nr:Na+/H+ antiporter NhaA [Campylobacter iguaniorum]AII14228.1 Na+/H+ antiporter [Campylobacter iguaniorum]
MDSIKAFLQKESASGILIIFSMILALILANNGALNGFYTEILRLDSGVIFGNFSIVKPTILWVNDGLMAIFFFMIGLELKYEFLEGELNSIKKVALPAIAGIGGVIFPALIFYALNHSNDFNVHGWAIPTVSDTAFALAILFLLGSKIPVSLKLFLLSLAIIDDVAAIVIIAIFYTTKLSIFSLILSLFAIIALAVLNYKNNQNKLLYLACGIILWVAVLKSGVHATLAGIIASLFIPLKDEYGDSEHGMLNSIMHFLHPIVAFLILPIFAFSNAGVVLSKDALMNLFHPVPLGIMLGLFVGKQIGVFSFAYLAIKLKLADLPQSSNWLHLYGLSILTGVGMSMSLFVDGLAYADSNVFLYANKIAILVASTVCAVLGYIVLRRASKDSLL